jgi:hypothetical protein
MEELLLWYYFQKREEQLACGVFGLSPGLDKSGCLNYFYGMDADHIFQFDYWDREKLKKFLGFWSLAGATSENIDHLFLFR